jgi:hypothetical protein
MNKKILTAAALVVVFSLGFLYLNQGYLSANDKESKSCTNKSACDDKNKEVKAGGDLNQYEFTTDKACCDEMKADLQNELTSVAGVKEVKFGKTCGASKMTHVTVYYAAGETSEDALAKFVKDKSYDCQGKTGCDKEATKSGTKSGTKEGCDKSKECCPNKEKKSSEQKQL